MPDGINLTSGAGVSRWVPTSTPPGVVRYAGRESTRQKLLSDAASLVPDEQMLVETLTKRKLDPASMGIYGTLLRQGLTDYLSEYRKNPYYAFTREGTQQARRLQSIVTDPRLGAIESAYEKSQKEYDKLSDAQLTGNISVSGGGQAINVFDLESKSLRAISPSAYDSNKHRLLTVGDHYQLRTNDIGFYQDQTPFQVNMRKPEDVKQQYFTYFQSLGDTQKEQFRNDLKVTSKSNLYQIQSRINALTSPAGLSEADKNTLFSEAYTRAARQGRQLSEKEAAEEVLGEIGKIAEGYVETSVDTSVDPSLTASSQRAGLANANVFERSFAGEWDSQFVPMSGSNRNVGLQLNFLPIDQLNESNDTYTNSRGDKVGKRNLESLQKGFTSTVGLDTMYVPSLNSGEEGVFKPVNISGVAGEVVVKKVAKEYGTTSLTYMVEDGSRVYMPLAELERRLRDKYRGMGEQQYGNVINELSTKGLIGKSEGIVARVEVMAKRGLGAETPEILALDNDFKNAGYTPQSVGSGSQRFNEYIANVSTDKSVGTSWLDEMGAIAQSIIPNVTSARPDMYEAIMVIPSDALSTGWRSGSTSEPVKQPNQNIDISQQSRQRFDAKQELLQSLTRESRASGLFPTFESLNTAP